MAATAAPRVVHALPGRVRVHVPAWSGDDGKALEARLVRGRGVRRVQASARTRNVLVEYDHDHLDEATVVRRLARAVRDVRAVPRRGAGAAASPPRRGVLVTHSSVRRARIAVPGLEHDPDIAQWLVERLGRRAEV